MNDYIYYDATLISLAYYFLVNKSKITKKKYTINDLILTCDKILKKIDYMNRTADTKIIVFEKGYIKIRKDREKDFFYKGARCYNRIIKENKDDKNKSKRNKAFTK